MTSRHASVIQFVSAFIVCALLAVNVSAALSEKLRVLSFEAPTAANYDRAGFKALLDKADPDILFLQGVADWDAADQIGKLRPGLRVVTCSAFSGNAGQVAILARDKALLSWVEPVGTAGGFAMAVMQIGARKVAVFSVQSSDSAAVTDRLISEVKKLQQFANNRPEAFIVSGRGVAGAAIAQATFETVPADVTAKASSGTELWTANVGFLSRPRAIPLSGMPRPVVVADLDTANAFATKFAYQNALLLPGENPPPIAVTVQPAAKPQPRGTLGIIIGLAALVSIAVGFLIFRRRPATTALVALNDPSLPTGGPALNDPVRQGLLVWFKTIFMQRVLADRRRMIADEADATRRTLAIEQKLSELQVSLQDRISGYEGRIARLEGELSAATMENRELIRHQINDLKQKVAKAKEDFVYERN